MGFFIAVSGQGLRDGFAVLMRQFASAFSPASDDVPASSVVQSVAASEEVTELPADRIWSFLEANQDAVMVDVRTRAEWSFVGVPDLGDLPNRLILLEWQSFPSMAMNQAFCDTLDKELGERRDAPVVFLCRSGARSMAAAQAMTGYGYSNCVNVSDGFEGDLGPDRRRGVLNGWKAAGLPWAQT